MKGKDVLISILGGYIVATLPVWVSSEGLWLIGCLAAVSFLALMTWAEEKVPVVSKKCRRFLRRNKNKLLDGLTIFASIIWMICSHTIMAIGPIAVVSGILLVICSLWITMFVVANFNRMKRLIQKRMVLEG